MFNLTPLTEQNFIETVNFWENRDFLTKTFFGSFIILNTFFNQGNLELYQATWKDQKYIIYTKKNKNEWRFLFKEPVQEFINEIIQKTSVDYIAVNFLTQQPLLYKTVTSLADELMVDIDKVVSLENKKIRHDYRRALVKNEKLKIKRYTKEDKEKIKEMLYEWKTSRTELQNSVALIENDERFLKLYGDTLDVNGITIWDDAKIIGYCLFVPCFEKKNICISVFSKVLRGYADLGMLVAVEKYKAMQEFGFSKAILGTINNDFKKHFLTSGSMVTTYSTQAYADPKIVFKSSAEEYLDVLFI